MFDSRICCSWQNELIERDRLFSRLEEESPELAAKIRSQMEEKHAEMRMLKRQNARRKWAKLALRYGGKEMQTVISREAQQDRDEKEALERILSRSPGRLSDDEESEIDLSSGDDDSDKVDKGRDYSSRIVKRAKTLIEKEIESDEEEEFEEENKRKRVKGLMGMKFMQTALEKEKRRNKKEAEEELARIGMLEGNVFKCIRRKWVWI